MSFVWSFGCETCEEQGPDFKRSAGGLGFDSCKVQAFLIEHQWHDVVLLRENETIEHRCREHEPYVEPPPHPWLKQSPELRQRIIDILEAAPHVTRVVLGGKT